MTQASRRTGPAPAAARGLPARPLPPPLPLVRRWDLRQSLMLAALLAVWLFTRPWAGIWHDSRLYTVQALHLLYPTQFQNDLFFLFGSQDSFTVFSPVYAACIQALGLDTAAHVLHLAGSALWLGGAYFLLSKFLRGPVLWIGLACLLLLQTEYDPTRSLSLAEPSLTPRLYAEALGMLAIGCMLRGARGRAALALLLCCALHPLMALPCLLFCVLFLAEGRGRPLAVLAGLGTLAALACGMLGVVPFDRLLHTMDPAWFGQVARLSPMVTWESWQFSVMGGRTLVAFSLVLTAAWLSGGWHARFYYCAALTGALGLLAAWLGTGLCHNLLALQVQPWRALWLVQLSAVIALVWLVAAFWRRGPPFQLLLAALLLGVMARDGGAAVLALAAAPVLCWQVRRAAPPALPQRLHGLLCLGLLALVAAWLGEVNTQAAMPSGILNWQYAERADEALFWGWTWVRLGGGALLGSALMAAIWRWAGRGGLTGKLAASALALASLAGAYWMNQGYAGASLRISAPARQAVQARFQPLIPPQATVYWQEEVRASWQLLQRSSYASLPQVFGAVFNRGTALEGVRRLQRLQRLGVRDSVWGRDRAEANRMLGQLPRMSVAGLAYVCEDPALGFVVLEQRFGTLAIATVEDRVYDRGYYLYDCARVRASHVSD